MAVAKLIIHLHLSINIVNFTPQAESRARAPHPLSQESDKTKRPKETEIVDIYI